MSKRTDTELFVGEDREQVNQIITNLRQSYLDRLHETQLEFHRAQRAVNRASHEITRLEKHLERINQFVEVHNVELKEGQKLCQIQPKLIHQAESSDQDSVMGCNSNQFVISGHMTSIIKQLQIPGFQMKCNLSRIFRISIS